MKTAIQFSFFCLMLVSALGNAQSHWLQEGQHWKVSVQDGWHEAIIANQVVQGDTIIAGVSCKIIQGPPELFYPWFPRFGYADGNKVYVYHDQIQQFQKIYDFDAVAGDTIAFEAYFVGPVHYIIDSIGVVMINGFDRVVQHAHIPAVVDIEYPQGSFQIIEGVGMTRPSQSGNPPSYVYCAYFFMDAYSCLFGSDGRDTKLLCYEDAEISLSFYNDCDFVSNAGSPGNEDHGFTATLFPNPTSDGVHLKFSESSSHFLCKIKNAAGRIIHQQEMTGDTGYLSTTGWASGMYFVEVSDKNNKIDYQRLIITK